jgi:hypothetical protein
LINICLHDTRLGAISISRQDNDLLEKHPHLKILELGRCIFDDDLVERQFAENFRSLKYLQMMNPSWNIMHYIGSLCPALESLELYDVNVDEAERMYLIKLFTESLKRLARLVIIIRVKDEEVEDLEVDEEAEELEVEEDEDGRVGSEWKESQDAGELIEE